MAKAIDAEIRYNRIEQECALKTGLYEAVFAASRSPAFWDASLGRKKLLDIANDEKKSEYELEYNHFSRWFFAEPCLEALLGEFFPKEVLKSEEARRIMGEAEAKSKRGVPSDGCLDRLMIETCMKLTDLALNGNKSAQFLAFVARAANRQKAQRIKEFKNLMEEKMSSVRYAFSSPESDAEAQDLALEDLVKCFQSVSNEGSKKSNVKLEFCKGNNKLTFNPRLIPYRIQIDLTYEQTYEQRQARAKIRTELARKCGGFIETDPIRREEVTFDFELSDEEPLVYLERFIKYAVSKQTEWIAAPFDEIAKNAEALMGIQPTARGRAF